MKTMQKFFMMMVVVLMAGFVTSCGDDDNNDLGTYTIGLTVSERGGLTEQEVSLMNYALKSMEQSFSNTTESRARAAFEESFKKIDTSKLSTEKDYTLEYFLKNSSGTKIATHNIIIKNGNVTLK